MCVFLSPVSVPCSSRLQPIVGWIHLQHTRMAVAFARWLRVYSKLHQITVIYEQRARVSKIFARGHLAIAITSIALLLISFVLLLIVVNLKKLYKFFRHARPHSQLCSSGHLGQSFVTWHRIYAPIFTYKFSTYTDI